MLPIDIRIQYTFFTPALTTLLYGPWLNFSFYFGHTSWCVEFQFADHGSNPHTLQWKCGVLTTGPPGKLLNTWSHILFPLFAMLIIHRPFSSSRSLTVFLISESRASSSAAWDTLPPDLPILCPFEYVRSSLLSKGLP